MVSGRVWSRQWRRYALPLGTAWRCSPAQSSVLVLAVLCGVAAAVAMPVLLGLVIQAVGDDPGRLTSLAVTLAAAFFLQRVLTELVGVLSLNLSRRTDGALQRALMHDVSRPARMSHLDDADIRSRVEEAAWVTGQHWERPSGAVEHVPQVWAARLTALGCAGLLLWWQWWLAVLVLLSSGWLAYEAREALSRVAQHHFGQTGTMRRAQYFSELATTPAAAKEVRVLGLMPFLLHRHDRSWSEASTALAAVYREGGRRTRAAVLASTLVIALTIWLLGRDGVAGAVDAGHVAMYAQAVLTAFSVVIAATTGPALHLQYALAACDKHLAGRAAIRSLVEETIGAAAAAGDLERSPTRSIEVVDVHFRYPGQDRAVLAGLTLSIPAGRSLAIVGSNGAGKTTLVKLLCGLLQPTDGHVAVDGVDLAEVAAGQWQRRLSAVFQDHVQFPLTVADAIGFGSVDHMHDVDRLRAAADDAGLTDLLSSLPGGLDTPLSAGLRGGRDLSGGQWQRVALARALFAVSCGAGVLILDEPTANLDVRGEAQLYEQFLRLTRGLTTIVVSHRFSTVRQADQIAVVDEGRLVEFGSHDELLAAAGRYATMFRLQAARFASTASTEAGS